ncbi:hypothetical protein [Gluconobacter cerinus]|uniref:hypothetical protein n=1 Tax=Gluconobacter cerinus TaxID=38307 RepID=UPI001B8C2C9D|nr:hypothetical protein [Gluconobacter cerinus]MBS0984467.1 hypothetical protein [Gluconobacter cerinus]
MTSIPSSFTIPGTFVTIQGTGSATSNAGTVILMAASTSLTQGSGVTFDITSQSTTTYTPKTVAINASGTGYAVNDIINLNNVGTLTVTKVDTSGAISTFTSSLSTEALVSNMAATGVSGTGGSGTGATFDITSNTLNSYAVSGVEVNAQGSGYHVGDVFTLTGATVTVTSINSSGAIITTNFVATTQALTSDPSSTNISPIATTTITGPVNTLTYADSQSTVDGLFGTASDISRMYARYRAVDITLPVYVIAAASDSTADITACLNSIPEASFSLIASPFNSSGSVKAFGTYFDVRYGYASELYGIHITSKTDTVSNLIEYGATVNSEYSTVVAFSEGSVDDDVVKAAALAAVIAPSLASDPSLPIQLMNLDVAASGNAFTIPDRLSLFNAGLTTTKEDSAGDVYLERSRTTYQTNADGVSDNTYQDTETLPQVTLVAETFRTGVNTKFFTNRMKLSPDSSTVIAGQNIATPSAIKATLISLYQNMVQAGLVTDATTFANSVTVTIKSAGVVSVYAPVTLIEQLRQIDININFTK